MIELEYKFEEIKNYLVLTEQQYSVRILYACESGSRAWGFPSQNSDYDQVQELLQRKLASDELAEGPRIPVLNEFIDSELARLESQEPPMLDTKEKDTAALDELIWDVLST